VSIDGREQLLLPMEPRPAQGGCERRKIWVKKIWLAGLAPIGEGAALRCHRPHAGHYIQTPRVPSTMALPTRCPPPRPARADCQHRIQAQMVSPVPFPICFCL